MKINSCLFAFAITLLTSTFLMAQDFQSLSPKQIQAEVASLKKEDTAWRKIAWKTCLLEGLKESREKNKPIILWIFIDRPIDDERC